MENPEYIRSVIKRSFVFFLFFILLPGCGKNEEGMFTAPSSKETGINFINTLTESKDQNILDYLYFYNGGGVSTGDINNDGLPDIFFVGNQVKNKLYLNLGNFKFEDITDKAAVAGESTWNTGVTMADVNGDGLLDIYVSAVVGVNGFFGNNELFINNGDLTFTESAADYGLDLENYSSQAAFFDADNDGDLDVFILNHAVHTTESFGPAEIRNTRVEESGDKLLINNGGKFVDVSEEAGIFGGANSYGLGISTADFNNDGFTDIYVGNDFHEDDYYYINNGDGTFTESLKSHFGLISRFSMGSDVADINNDGYVDLLTLDMLPEDEKVLKSSAGDDNVNLHKLRTEKLGYHPQYTRNMLQINREGEYFEETALMSGIAATDWSWGALFADFDRDGNQDVFISTGIPRRPNDLDYVKYTSNEQIQQKLQQTHLVDQKALNLMPSGAVKNVFFRGNNGFFEDMTNIWIKEDTLVSSGLAYADLDNDGNLDLVVNNINQPATIYRNINSEGAFLKINLKTSGANKFGIGSKAILYTETGRQYRQLYTTKGFQSSSEPVIYFGFPAGERVDSLRIIWPDNTYQTVIKPEVNQALTISPKKNREKVEREIEGKKARKWFTKAEQNFGIDYDHKENEFSDFDVQKLIPHQISDNTPAVTVADVNKDGKEDIIFGASRFKPGIIYIQEEEQFKKIKPESIALDSILEDTRVAVLDINKDGKNDIIFTSGGGEAIGNSPQLLDRMYLGQGDVTFSKDQAFPKMFSNSSVIKVADYDNDGYPDVFIGSDAVNYNYGATPQSHLLHNEKGRYKIVEEKLFSGLGMVTDAVWEDFDQDGDLDLIVVGEWMTPKFIENDKGKFREVTEHLLENPLNGLWQSIEPFDVDGDGDTDYLLGNWGLNSKFKASPENPLVMYYADFDENGLTETLLAQEKDGKYYLHYGLDELVSQLTFLKKKFPAYKDFAGKTVSEVMGAENLAKAQKMEVHQLATGYLENRSGKYTFKSLPGDLQVAPVKTFLKYDFNGDGEEEVLIGGNYFGVTPYHGKFGAMAGAIIKKGGKMLNSKEIGLNFTQKAVKDFSVINIRNRPYLLVTFNNAPVELYTLNL